MLLAAKDLPDLQFDTAEAKGEDESSERTDVIEIIDVDVNESVTISHNSNS